MNRRQRRARKGGVDKFAQELKNVIEGRPADPSVRRFFDEFTAANGIAVARVHEGGEGIEVLRDPKRTNNNEGENS